MTLRASAKRGVKLFDANEFVQTTGKLLGWKVPPPPSTVLQVQDIDVTLALDARTNYWNETLRPDPPALPGIMLFDAEDYTKRTGKHLSHKTIFAAECPPRRPIEMDFGAGMQSHRTRAPPETLTSRSFIKIPIAPFDTNIPAPTQPSGEGGWKPFFLEKTRPREKNSCWNFFFPKKACAFPTDVEPRTPTATSFRSTHVARASQQQQRPTEASIFDFLFSRRPIRIKLKASKKQVTIMGDDMPMLEESDDDDAAFDEWWTISTRGRADKHAAIQPHFIT